MGSLEEEKEISQFLLSHPDFLKDWILNQADQKILEDLSEVLQVILHTIKVFANAIRNICFKRLNDK